MKSVQEAQLEIIDQFSIFDDWMGRYEYLISLGKKLSFPEDQRTAENFIHGCQSQVWIAVEQQEDRLFFSGISDSAIVSGLIAVLMEVYSGQTPEDILKTPADFISEIGFESHLSPTRRNGLSEMLKTIKRYAQEAIRERT